MRDGTETSLLVAIGQARLMMHDLQHDVVFSGEIAGPLKTALRVEYLVERLVQAIRSRDTHERAALAEPVLTELSTIADKVYGFEVWS